jgi:TfoX/Sxy family transcriptional regulator of competence genes
MAYDEALAQRLRGELADRDGLEEKKMFGGLAFLVHGNMCVGVRGDDLLARVAPARFDEVVARPGARPFAMGGRTMAGWVLVDGAQIGEPDTLTAWIEEADRFVQTLPKK